MTTKMEERIKRMLDEQLERQMKAMEERMSGVFVYGMVIGIILCYSGILGYAAGVVTGVTLTTKYRYIALQLTEKGTYYFHALMKSLSRQA